MASRPPAVESFKLAMRSIVSCPACPIGWVRAGRTNLRDASEWCITRCTLHGSIRNRITTVRLTGVNADPNNPSVQDDVVEGLETSGDHGEPDSIEGDADPALARLGRTNSRSASFVVRLH